MMEKYNREKPIIYNTIQLYRHDRLEFLKKSHEQAQSEAAIFSPSNWCAARIWKKSASAPKRWITRRRFSPIKQATDRDFNAALEYCLENIKEIAFVAGTHNEESVRNLAQNC